MNFVNNKFKQQFVIGAPAFKANCHGFYSTSGWRHCIYVGPKPNNM